MKKKNININDMVSVTLTEYGKSIAMLEGELLIKEATVNGNRISGYTVKAFKNAYLKSDWQLWELMAVFGKYMEMGMKEIPFELNRIEIK